MAKGIDVRETQSGLFFRALLQNSSGLLASSGTAQLAIYQLNYPDGGLLSYDFNDDTFKSGVLSSGLIALTHRTVNSGTVDTGLYTYRHTTLTNFVARNIYFARVIHSGALPYDQVREFQYGSKQGDGDPFLSGFVSVSGAVTLSGIPTNWSLLNIDSSGKVVVGSGAVLAQVSGGVPANFTLLNIDSSGKVVVGSGAVLAQVSGGVPTNFTALAISAGGLVSVSGAVSVSGIPANWFLLNIDSSGKVVVGSGPGNVSGGTPTNFNLLAINSSGQVDATISGGFPTNFARLNIDVSGKVVVGSGAVLAQVSGGIPTNFALLNIDGSGKVVVGSGAILAQVSGGVPTNFALLNIDSSGKVVVASGMVLATISGGVPPSFNALSITPEGFVTPASGTIMIDTFGSGVIRYLGDIQLIRNISGLIEGSGPPQSLASVVLKLTSRFDSASGRTYRCDGTTVHMTQAVTQGSGLPPIKELGVGA